jgi:polyisoprenoid-binding protein YceI
MTRRVALLAAVLLISACGGVAAPAPASTSSPTAAPTASPTAAATTTPGAWTVTGDTKATISVREQLVGVNLPSDAVLTAKGAKGTFAVNADGTFSADSKITIDLTTLASDQRDRDNFIKQDTLQVRQFPTATFVPTKATGLTLPIAADTDLKFTLAGKMTIHGTTKDVTFDVVAKRSGGTITATATANPTWKFEDFGMRAPAVAFRVVSVNDEIRVVIDLVATGAAS